MLTHRQILTILGGLMSGMFLAALDQTIVATAARPIADDLNSLSMQAWITTAYLITATIATPLYGKLSDIYGRKSLYLIAISVFLVGSIASAFAQSMTMLAVSRAVQGAGAGGLMSLALTILGDVVSPRQRAKYQGYFLAVFGTATVVGPLVGGALAGAETVAGVAGWRWVFLINVPIGAIALFVVARVLNVPHERQRHRIDWGGAAALVLTLVPLLLVSQEGREWGWGSATALTCYGIGAFGLALFCYVEHRMGDAALLPLRLFSNATFSVSVGGGFVVGIAMFGAIMLIPQYLQIVQGYSPTKSGLLMLPLMLGMMSATVISGQLTARTGRYKIFPVLGTAIMAVGMLLFTGIEWNSPIWQPLLYMAVIGIGLGGCMQTLMIAVQNAGPRRDMGVSTATATLVRQTGGTVGVAVFLSVLFSTLTGNIKDAFRDAGVRPDAALAGTGGDVMKDSSFLGSLSPEQAEPIYVGFTESVTTVFTIGAGVAVLACLVLLFMREIPLSDTVTDNGPEQEPVDGTTAAETPPVQRLDVVTDEGSRTDLNSEFDTEFDTEFNPVRETDLVLVGKHWRMEERMQPENNGDRFVDPLRGAAIRATADAADGGQGPSERPISGRIRRSDASSVAGAALTLIDQGGKQVGRGTGHEDGSYTIGAPGWGSYVLIVSADGHQPQASGLVVGDEPVTLDFTLAGSAELIGVVRLDGHDRPVADVTITLTDGRGEVVDAYTTGGDGAYRFAGVGSGRYTLVASGPRLRPMAEPVTVPESGVLQHDVKITGAVALEGVARNMQDRVVPDARVTVLDVEGNVAAVAQTDDAGRYLVNDLPLGDYTVVASGYPPATSRVSLAGEQTDHDVRLGYEETSNRHNGQVRA